MKNKTKNKITWTFSGVDKTYPIASAMSCGCKIGILFSIACLSSLNPVLSVVISLTTNPGLKLCKTLTNLPVHLTNLP
jgi:hypothetical protein